MTSVLWIALTLLAAAAVVPKKYNEVFILLSRAASVGDLLYFLFAEIRLLNSMIVSTMKIIVNYDFTQKELVGKTDIFEVADGTILGELLRVILNSFTDSADDNNE